MSIPDHFVVLDRWAFGQPLTPVVRTWEDVHVDQYDPTYGSTHTTRSVYNCTTCGALVIEPDIHAAWHDRQVPS